MEVILGLGAAIAYGAGDFAGGLVSRRANVLIVVALSQVIGSTILIPALFIVSGDLTTTAMGWAMVLALLQARYGPDTRRFSPAAFPTTRFEVAGASVSLLQVLILAVSLSLMAALAVLVQRTRLGRGMRAIAEDPHAARVLGIDVDRVTAITFALSSALGAGAGVLFALNVNSAQFAMGFSIELKGLAVIIVGGMGSLPGAMVGGLLLGLAEVFAVSEIGSSWRDVVAFGLLFAILLVRPRGIFGVAQRREV